MRAGGELDGARSPIASSTLALIAHACGGTAACARLWLMRDPASPMCVASSDRPGAFPIDTAIAKTAIRTQKICPVVLTNSRDGAFPMSCEQHTVVYAALMPLNADVGKGASEFALEVIMPDDSFDGSRSLLDNRATGAHEISAAVVIEVRFDIYSY